MKICRFLYQDRKTYGILKDGKIYPTENVFDISESNFIFARDFIEFEKVKLIIPVSPSKIVCVGRNYAAHAAELGNEIPKDPLLFLKAPSALILDGENIEIPAQSSQVEHEGELAVVIGRTCKNLATDANVSEFVLGYMCLNDVTARDLQKKDIQFARAKSFDTFCPVGKFIETDLDTSDLSVVTKVNGEIKQSGRTSEMVFSIEYLIHYISKQMTLYPGDIVATGTPSGVSRLDEGDICEIEIERLDSLTNPVIKV